MKTKLLIILTFFCSMNLWAKKTPQRVISADVTQVEKPLSSTYFNCVGAGRAAEGLRGDWQAQLAELQSVAPFDYIRFHGLFHDDMGVYFKDDKGNETYNFQYIDALYDFLLSVNIRPFVELSFLPKDMTSGQHTIFWWKGNVDTPKSYEDWGNLVKAFTQHVTDRYGKEEVSKWYFEVWNEPNLKAFFEGTMEDYFKLYEAAAMAVKSVNESYRVGGPATAGNGWVEEFITHCKENNLPLDFFATHHYGVHGALDEFGVQQLRMSSNPAAVYDGVNATREKIDALTDEHLELHYTEWSSSYSPRDLTHDTYLNAAYVLNTLRHTDTSAESMSYWTFTDIFEESGIPTKPFHGGFGLVTMAGIKKPTYFSYIYLSKLGGNEIKNSDDNSWVTKDNDGNIQILAYDMTMPDLEAMCEFNNRIFAKEVIPSDKGNLEIKLSGVEDGLYNLEVYHTGHRHNDAQTTYFEIGSPNVLSPTQKTALESHTQNQAEITEIVNVKNGKFDYSLPLKDNDVYLVKLNRIKGN